MNPKILININSIKNPINSIISILYNNNYILLSVNEPKNFNKYK